MRLRIHGLVLIPIMAAGSPAVLAAQMIGVPVLQSAFVNPGVTAGIDFGTGSDASAIGGAIAWSPGSARSQLSGGAAYLSPSDGESGATWGVRLAVPLFTHPTSRLGFAGFLGVGGVSAGGQSDYQLPIGASASYRFTVGGSRSVSVYANPFFSGARHHEGDVTTDRGLFRIGFGVDAALIPGLGITVGYETGMTSSGLEPGPRGGIFGVGVSYALRRPR